MRRLLPLLAALAATPALATADRFVFEDGSNGATSAYSLLTTTYQVVAGQGSTTLVPHTCAANTCTRAKPSAATEGMDLGGIGSYEAWACVSSGTFTGAGAVQFYVYNISGSSGATWAYAVGKDWVPGNGDGPCDFIQDRSSFGPSETRLAARAVAVGTSVAAPVLEVRLLGCKRGGCVTAWLERPPAAHRYARAGWRAPPRSWAALDLLPPERKRRAGVRA